MRRGGILGAAVAVVALAPSAVSWSYALPRRFKPPLGTYEDRVQGFDILGNLTAAASAASRTPVAFRVAA